MGSKRGHQTMRPGSVEARAKMKVMGLQEPSRSSFPPDTGEF